MMNLLRREEGFTLIELMIVIAIIGILAGIALPRFADTRATAEFARARAEMKNLQTALEMEMATQQQYPTGTTFTNILNDNASNRVVNNLTQTTLTSASYVLDYSDPDTSGTIQINSNGDFLVTP